MKKILIVIIAGILFSACTFPVKDKEPEYKPVNLPKTESSAKSGWACPMKCEGDKVYQDSTQKCPACDMDLVKVN